MIRIQPFAVLAIALLLGCATPNYRRAESAEKSAGALRAGIAELQQTTDWSLTTLQRFAAAENTDPRAIHLLLRQCVTELDRRGRRMTSQARRLRAHVGAYYDHWRNDLSVLTDEEMRQASAQRRNVLIDTYNRVPPLTKQAQQQLQTYLAQLRDLDRYLGNDLTPAGIQSAAPFIERASQTGHKLQTDLTTLTQELDTVAGALTATPR
jgi:DNA repair exonuclease SbcCD ATPase subunit